MIEFINIEMMFIYFTRCKVTKKNVTAMQKGLKMSFFSPKGCPVGGFPAQQ
ncbi:hypothetical protein HMPREF9136_0634 [Prevotella dentalis DSM 3688]|uniref:Uncharacterized protein n=1 Tax=Prevotella dentalis (strain ATCC 49559 / DSM 3688 / JCM 13448 / NCTC 12043 / ES 2772) TaxID=908937 RepID=F9D1A6_PREDD|nr:hypothetical protein HMPREF9136_0634 [Prevotella dentalis DSM 3688]